VEYHSKHFGIVAPVGTRFWQPQGLSKPPDCHSKYYHISLVKRPHEFHMHRPRWHTSRPGNSSIFSYRDIEPSSRRLPIDSSSGSTPTSWNQPLPDEPLKCGRSPRSSGPLFSSQHSNPTLGFRAKCWTHI